MLSRKDIQIIKEMLTEQFVAQIEVLRTIFVTKEEFYERFEEMDQKFSVLQSSVDAIAKRSSELDEEQIILNYRTRNLEKFADKAAPKLKIKFEH